MPKSTFHLCPVPVRTVAVLGVIVADTPDSPRRASHEIVPVFGLAANFDSEDGEAIDYVIGVEEYAEPLRLRLYRNERLADAHRVVVADWPSSEDPERLRSVIEDVEYLTNEYLKRREKHPVSA